MTVAAPSERITFVHSLRGIAALLVVISHYLGVFWLQPSVAAALVNSDVFEGPVPNLVVQIHRLPYLDVAHVGVALFFLISGFVIPFSLMRLGPWAFLLARMFRLWPTYLMGLAITLTAISVSGRIWGHTFPYSVSAILSHLFFVHDLFSQPGIDGIVWTLEVEIKFYLLCALISSSIVRGSARLAVLTGILLLLCSLGIYHFRAGATSVTNALLLDCMMLSYMLVGVIVHLCYRHALSLKVAAAICTALIVSFAWQWHMTRYPGPAESGVPNYLFALSLFVLCLTIDKYIRPSRWLSFLAEISYPLYAVHGVMGYAVLRLLIAIGINGYAAIVAVFGIAVVLAYIGHRLIEQPTMAFGKRLARRCTSDISARISSGGRGLGRISTSLPTVGAAVQG